VVRGSFGLHKYPIDLMGEVGQDTVTLRKLLSNITFPCCNFLSTDCGLQRSGGKETPVFYAIKSRRAPFGYLFINFALAGRIRV